MQSPHVKQHQHAEMATFLLLAVLVCNVSILENFSCVGTRLVKPWTLQAVECGAGHGISHNSEH